MTRTIKASDITPTTTPTQQIDVIASIHGQTVPVTPKAFKTGSVGYFGVGKIALNGKKYQAQVQLVEIGSKPKA